MNAYQRHRLNRQVGGAIREAADACEHAVLVGGLIGLGCLHAWARNGEQKHGQRSGAQHLQRCGNVDQLQNCYSLQIRNASM